MSIDFWTIGLVIAVLMVPMMVQLYVHRLPEAPSCPTCSRTTRPVSEWQVARWVPALAATSLGECTLGGPPAPPRPLVRNDRQVAKRSLAVDILEGPRAL